MATTGTAGTTVTVEQLAMRLREAYGSTLQAVVLYGDAAGSGAPAGTRPQVLVLVDALPVDALERAATAMQAWIAAGNEAPLTLTTAEWRSSADVFAIEYADVIERHRVVHGTLPLDGVQVTPADIRRELEEQVLGKLLKLRRGIMESGGDQARERTLLEVSLGTFLALFGAVLRLHGERVPADPATLCERTGAHGGFPADAFVRVVRHVRGEKTLQPADVRPVLAGYLAGLEALIAHLDRWTPGTIR